MYIFDQGPHASWNVLKNHPSPGMSWNSKVEKNHPSPGKVSWKMGKQDQIMVSGSDNPVSHLLSKAWYDCSTDELYQSTDCGL